MDNDIQRMEKQQLLSFSLQVWPELTNHVDRIIVYYVGPMGNSWPVFEESPDETFIDTINEKVKEGKDILLLCNISESLRETTINKIHRTLNRLNINPSRVFMTTGSLNGIELYEKHCNDHGYNERINILPANSFLKVSRELQQINGDEYIPKVRAKKFLCFNRVERKHRIILTAKLLLENLLNNSFYSFYGNNYDNSWLTRLEEIPEQYHDILKTNTDLFPMHLTGNKSSRNNPIDMVEEDRILYEESYYSITTETTFFKGNETLARGTIPSIFFTEKTYKPMVMKHPFILVTMPKSLQWLKNMGFKTFSPFINESYDDEQDDDTRLQMIVDEVKRLDTLTDQQWIDWQIGVKDIVEHNFKVYNSITISSLGLTTANVQ
jgi:hypothetical protein